MTNFITNNTKYDFQWVQLVNFPKKKFKNLSIYFTEQKLTMNSCN